MAELSVVLRRGWMSLPLLAASVAYPAQRVTDLVNNSDAVVIAAGSFTSRSDGTLVSLSVTEWLSTTPPGASGSLQALEPYSSFGPPHAGAVFPARSALGIWFLASRGDGTYNVVPVRVGKVPRAFFMAADRGSCPGDLAYTADTSLTDKIALELACAATKDFGPADFSAESMVGGTFGLGSSQRVHEAFVYLAQLPGSRQRAIGIACLIDAKDALGLELLSQHIGDLDGHDLQTIAGPTVLGWRGTDSGAIASLGRIATSPRATGALLKYACIALDEIHSAETLPYLRLLLDNPDRGARVDAIRGFVEFINGYPVHTPENSLTMEFMTPSPTPYSSDATWKQYGATPDASDAQLQAAVTFWKGWLSSHPELPQLAQRLTPRDRGGCASRRVLVVAGIKKLINGHRLTRINTDKTNSCSAFICVLSVAGNVFWRTSLRSRTNELLALVKTRTALQN